MVTANEARGTADEIATLVLRSIDGGATPSATLRTMTRALSKRVPRCLVGIGLNGSLLETARAGRRARWPADDYLRLVSTGRLPFDATSLPRGHRGRWIEPLRGFLDPARYAASPVGRLTMAHGVFYFGRHFVCVEGHIVATVGAWLPRGVVRFSTEERAILASTARTLAPMLRLLARASVGAAYEAVVVQQADRRGQAAFLASATGAVLAASSKGASLLREHPRLRGHLERMARGVSVERALPTLGVRLHVTPIQVGDREHRLITATPVVGRKAPVLTGRQRELVDHVENGRNNREIGLAMGVSAATVKTMLQRLYARTGTAGRMELVQWRAAARTSGEQ